MEPLAIVYECFKCIDTPLHMHKITHVCMLRACTISAESVEVLTGSMPPITDGNQLMIGI